MARDSSRSIVVRRDRSSQRSGLATSVRALPRARLRGSRDTAASSFSARRNRGRPSAAGPPLHRSGLDELRREFRIADLVGFALQDSPARLDRIDLVEHEAERRALLLLLSQSAAAGAKRLLDQEVRTEAEADAAAETPARVGRERRVDERRAGRIADHERFRVEREIEFADETLGERRSNPSASAHSPSIASRPLRNAGVLKPATQ